MHVDISILTGYDLKLHGMPACAAIPAQAGVHFRTPKTICRFLKYPI